MSVGGFSVHKLPNSETSRPYRRVTKPTKGTPEEGLARRRSICSHVIMELYRLADEGVIRIASRPDQAVAPLEPTPFGGWLGSSFLPVVLQFPSDRYRLPR